jgi:hypothetical protein
VSVIANILINHWPKIFGVKSPIMCTACLGIPAVIPYLCNLENYGGARNVTMVHTNVILVQKSVFEIKSLNCVYTLPSDLIIPISSVTPNPSVWNQLL